MRSLAVLGLALAIGACTDPSQAVRATPSPTTIVVAPTNSPSPTARPTPAPYPTIGPLPSDLDPKIRNAIEMRRMYRLRFDLEYVMKVEADPASFDAIGFRMSQEEWDQIGRDTAEQERVMRTTTAYGGAGPDEWAGLYIDREEVPGVVVALFTRDTAIHDAAIREELGDTELFATRQVRYSKSELERIREIASDDMGAPWVQDIPAVYDSVGVDVRENVVVIRVSSAVPDAAARIAAHYGVGDRIRVESDGTGARLIPWSTVVGRVTLPGGKPYKAPGSMPLALSSDGPGDSVGTCNGSDMGYGVGADGHFEYPCQIGRRTIYIQVPTDEDGVWRSIGQGRVIVEEGKTAHLEIELTERP